MDQGEALDDSARMWLPGHALNCYEGDALLRSWLTEPDLLTQRLARECGTAYRMRVVAQTHDAGGFTRAIELLVDDLPWVYAETRVPEPTLAAHQWLTQLGNRPLGEWLAERQDLTRSELEFCKVFPDDPLVARALARARLAPQALWVRRTCFAVSGAPFVLRELFYPHTGTRQAQRARAREAP
jgi:chorismate--pyruvate lyase